MLIPPNSNTKSNIPKSMNTKPNIPKSNYTYKHQIRCPQTTTNLEYVSVERREPLLDPLPLGQ